MFHHTPELARQRMAKQLQDAEAWRRARSAYGSTSNGSASTEPSSGRVLGWFASFSSSLTRLQASVGRFREAAPECVEPCGC
jgi:hypothetical protein